MLLKLFLFVFGLASTVQCEQPKPCCFPDKWEATEGIFAGSVNSEGDALITTGYIQLSYDATGKRIFGVATINTGGIEQDSKFLQLYNKGIQYSIINNTCTRSKLEAWNNQSCIPGNASFVSQYRLGLKQSITVNDFSYNIGAVANVVTVISDTCVPIVSERFGPIYGAKVMLAEAIQGATLGIKHESVFDVPKICISDSVIDDKETKKSLKFARVKEHKLGFH